MILLVGAIGDNFDFVIFIECWKEEIRKLRTTATIS